MPDLSLNSRQILLALARGAIRAHLIGSASERPARPAAEICVKRGCFVTLRGPGGGLRGCVGTFDETRPLFENVARMAQASAFEDARFAPLSEPEVDPIKIEISVLGPREKINSAEEIEIGRHGVWIECGPKGGTFLPEVAIEQRWSAEEFVAYCAREKAGLSQDELSHASLFRYEVEKFGDL